MSKIIEVNLGDLIPNDDFVYSINLQNVRNNWNQRAFDAGTWVSVADVDGKLYLPDGNHRVYVAFFERDIKNAKVNLTEEKDYRGLRRNPESKLMWEEYLDDYRKIIDSIRRSGVTCIRDLEHKIKSGSVNQDLYSDNHGIDPFNPS